MSGRQEELVAGWLDGSLTPAEQQELLEVLKTDPDFARAFPEEVEIHRGLQMSSLSTAEGDARAASRILHFVRASQEGTRFVEGVRQRALAGGRRPTARVAHPGTSRFGPMIAIAAALFVALLVGVMAYVGHRQKQLQQEQTAEIHAEVLEEITTPRREPSPDAPTKAPLTDERRKDQIEEDLRRAVEARKTVPAPKPEIPKPIAPEPEQKVVENKPETPTKPVPSSVEKIPALARLEKVQGEVRANGEAVPAGAELRDGVSIECSGLAELTFSDGTRVELSGAARLQEKLAGKRATGKGIVLVRGLVTAEVTKQPAGQAFLFMTPHAEVQVVGTRLSVQTGAETRVEVQEGQVRVTSLKGGQVVTLPAGQGLEIAASGSSRGHLSGLRATYYDQNTLKGQVLERVDPGVELSLDLAKNEMPPLGADHNFAARWEGRFLAEKEGDYILVLSVDGHVRFVFDGQELVADKKGVFHPIQRSVLRLKLAPGWHDLLIEYADDGGNSHCLLQGVLPGAKVDDSETFQREDTAWAIPPRLYSHTRK
jgi:hypothetical protein